MSPTRGALRLGRAALLGASCVLLSLTAHVLAGGALPSPLALLALTVPVACLSVLTTGERAGLPRIGLILAGTQVGLHEAFMLLAQPHCTVNGMAGHGSGHVAQPLSATTCAPAMQMAGGSTAMLAAHAVAAIGTGLLLWHGERLLWAFVTWLAVALPRPVAAQLTPVRDRPATPGVRRAAQLLAAIGGVGRRGPPVLAAA